MRASKAPVFGIAGYGKNRANGMKYADSVRQTPAGQKDDGRETDI